MMLRHIGLALLVIGGAFNCQNGKASSSPQRYSNSVAQTDMLKDLGRALSSTHDAGRLYYSSNCSSAAGDIIPFPAVVAIPAPGSTDSLDTIQHMFRENSDVVVTRAKRGLISVEIGYTANAVLKTKIHLMDFSPLQQFNPLLAIGAIENTKEMQGAMRMLGVHQILRVAAYALVPPANGWPHLPTSVPNLNADQLLDLVATTFKGIVVYGACTPPSLIDIHFVQITNQ
jgi:hypothetical protein